MRKLSPFSPSSPFFLFPTLMPLRSKARDGKSFPYFSLYVGDENLPLLYMRKKKEKGLNGMHNSNVEEEKTTRTHLLIFSGYEVCFSPVLNVRETGCFSTSERRKAITLVPWIPPFLSQLERRGEVSPPLERGRKVPFSPSNTKISPLSLAADQKGEGDACSCIQMGKRRNFFLEGKEGKWGYPFSGGGGISRSEERQAAKKSPYTRIFFFGWKWQRGNFYSWRTKGDCPRCRPPLWKSYSYFDRLVRKREEKTHQKST